MGRRTPAPPDPLRIASSGKSQDRHALRCPSAEPCWCRHGDCVRRPNPHIADLLHNFDAARIHAALAGDHARIVRAVAPTTSTILGSGTRHRCCCGAKGSWTCPMCGVHRHPKPTNSCLLGPQPSSGRRHQRPCRSPTLVDTDAIVPLDRMTSYRRELGIGDELVVMYAGNVGLSQSFELIEAAADHFAGRNDVVFVVNGDGSAKTDLMARCARYYRSCCGPPGGSVSVHFERAPSACRALMGERVLRLREMWRENMQNLGVSPRCQRSRCLPQQPGRQDRSVRSPPDLAPPPTANASSR
jgi:hypothetical protein